MEFFKLDWLLLSMETDVGQVGSWDHTSELYQLYRGILEGVPQVSQLTQKVPQFPELLNMEL